MKNTTILSASNLLRAVHGTVYITEDDRSIFDQNGRVVAKLKVMNGVYEVIALETNQDVVMLTEFMQDHLQYGHFDVNTLRKITGKKFKSLVADVCWATPSPIC